jgi:hypothetical protein
MAASADPASLSNLHDIVMPEAVSWWPLAPGWYVIVSLLLVFAVWATLHNLRRYRRNAYRRQALQELQALGSASGDPETRGRVLADVAELLRRVALSAYPRSRIVGLTGEAWLAFLDETGGGDAFSRGSGRLLVTGAYRTSGDYPADSVREVLTLATGWVNDHRPGAV